MIVDERYIFTVQFHGGTNFGRTAGNFIATSYDYDAPVDEYGMFIVSYPVCV